MRKIISWRVGIFLVLFLWFFLGGFSVTEAATVTLRPNAAGTWQQWTLWGNPSPPPSHWQGTSDQNSNSGVLIIGNTTAKETENLADTSVTGTITSVTAYVSGNSDLGGGAAEKGRIVWRTYNTDYESADITLVRSVGTAYAQTRTVNPNTGLAWTWTEVNALQVGSRASALGASEYFVVQEYWVDVNYTPPAGNTTTIGDGVNPSSITLAPGSSATALDSFTLQTNSGSDTVTAVTVTLSAGSSGGLSLAELTNDAGSVVYGSITNPVSDTLNFTGLSIPVSTTQTQFKVRVTPKSHGAMPAPPGSTYTVTGTVTLFTSTNSQSGSDTASATITIDNQSPANATGISGTPGSGQVSLSWTNPSDADFSQTVVLRAPSAVGQAPVEGVSYSVGNTIGTSTVACVVNTPSNSCVDSGLTNGTAYYYKLFSSDTRGNYTTGVSAGPYTPVATVPDATSVSYTVGGDGARSGDSITITGTNFGTVSVGNRANCAGGAGTGCVRFVVGGNTTVSDSSVTAWSNTSITFTVSSTLASNGGVLALQVVAASQADTTPLTFFVYPSIKSLVALQANAGREYAVGDTDGLVMVSGDHLGSAAGTIQFTGGFGSVAATIHGVAEGVCSIAGWAAAGTTVCAEIPTAIADTVYTGTITLTRSGDSKTDIWTSFRVLPRIITNDPATGVSGDTIHIIGNHFCESGTCPVSPNRSTATDNVIFGSTQAADSDFVTPTNGFVSVTSTLISTGGNNRLLLAMVSLRNTTGQLVNSVSGGGLTWERVASSTNGTNVRVEVWRTFATTPFSSVVTATLSAVAKATITVSSYSNVSTLGTNGSGAIGAVGTAVGNSISPAVTITTLANSSLVVSAFAVQDIPSVTAGLSQTIMGMQGTTGGTTDTRVTGGGERQNAVTNPSGNVTSSYTLGSAQPWAMVGVEIKKP